jgi:hypothetical protein
MSEQAATCSCGQLKATCEGRPGRVVACNCTWCQRRTGSPFGVGAYFPRSQVRISGNSSQFTRDCAEGRTLTNHFCPECGTNLFWFLDMSPDDVGVAVGGFADPAFERPARAVWTQHKHGWVQFPEDMEQFPKARTVPLPR